MVDDYAGYKTLFASNGHKETCIEPACLAHARRKFFDLHGANQSPIAWEALQRIGALYAIEAKGKELGMMRGSSCVGKKACPNFMLSMTGSYRPVSSPPTAALRLHHKALARPDSLCKSRISADRQQPRVWQQSNCQVRSHRAREGRPCYRCRNEACSIKTFLLDYRYKAYRLGVKR